MELQLKRLRRLKGLTQTQLAEEIDSTMRVVSAWERRETSLPFEDACRIADVLECSLDELAGREWRGERFADPGKNALVGYYDSMNDKGRDLLVQSAKHMSADPEVRIVKDSSEHADRQSAMGA